MTLKVTFRQLESSIGRELVEKTGTSPLEEWYWSVRETTIDK
jgi:hypothetical protein